MKKMIFLFLFSTSLWAMAQEKKYNWELNGDLYFADNTKKGIGLGVKLLRNFSEKHALTAGLAFNLFQLRSGGINGSSANKRTVPLMLGYQRRFNRFYLEPQVGWGAYAAKVFTPEYVLPSQGALFVGLEAGYRIRKFSLHVKGTALSTDENEYLRNSFQYFGVGVAIQL